MAMCLHHLANRWEQEAWKTLKVSMAGADMGSFWSILQDLFGDHFMAEEEEAEVAMGSEAASTSPFDVPLLLRSPHLSLLRILCAMQRQTCLSVWFPESCWLRSLDRMMLHLTQVPLVHPTRTGNSIHAQKVRSP